MSFKVRHFYPRVDLKQLFKSMRGFVKRARDWFCRSYSKGEHSHAAREPLSPPQDPDCPLYARLIQLRPPSLPRETVFRGFISLTDKHTAAVSLTSKMELTIHMNQCHLLTPLVCSAIALNIRRLCIKSSDGLVFEVNDLPRHSHAKLIEQTWHSIC